MQVENEVHRRVRRTGDSQNTATSSIRNNQTNFTWLSSTNVFQLLLAFRLLNALLVRTFFQPDEYYQALEPAWQLAFGDSGAAWITWEWRQHIRSALHPSLFASAYKAADAIATLFSLSRPNRAELLLAAPKILQAAIAATGDYYTWTFGRRIYGQDSSEAWATLLLTVYSPWQWFCSTRTFSNGLETTLTIMALNEWPWDWAASNEDIREGESSTPGEIRLAGLRRALLYAATATVLRPTNILIWVTAAAYTMYKAFKIAERGNFTRPNSAASSTGHGSHSAWSKVFLLVREAGLCGSAVLAVSALVDKSFYGTWTFPPYNFLYFNVFQSLAVFYGNNNWHYYLSEGYPLLLTTSIIFTLPVSTRGYKNYTSFGALSACSQATLKGLAIICITLPAALSILNHKEVRFIYPILPSLQIINALPLSEFRLAFTTRNISADHIRSRRRNWRILLLIILFLNPLIARYVTRTHNSGLLALPEYLRREFETLYLPQSPDALRTVSDLSYQNVPARNMTVTFLMPCHSVPWRSHLQYPPTQSQIGIQAWALTCEPPLHLTDPLAKTAYMDEADVFYDDPRAWIRGNMARKMPERADGVRDSNPNLGVRISDKALGHRNKKLWDSSHSTSKNHQAHTGLDITDLLPYLTTSPMWASNSSSASAPVFENNTPIRRPWPDYIAFFAQLELHQSLSRVMYSYGPRSGDVYHECWRGFNSHWHDDWRRKGDIIVWCLNSPAAKTDVDAGIDTATEEVEVEMEEYDDESEEDMSL